MFGLVLDILHFVAAGALSLLGLGYSPSDECEQSTFQTSIEFVVMDESTVVLQSAALISEDGAVLTEVSCEPTDEPGRPRRHSVI